MLVKVLVARVVGTEREADEDIVDEGAVDAEDSTATDEEAGASVLEAGAADLTISTTVPANSRLTHEGTSDEDSGAADDAGGVLDSGAAELCSADWDGSTD